LKSKPNILIRVLFVLCIVMCFFTLARKILKSRAERAVAEAPAETAPAAEIANPASSAPAPSLDRAPATIESSPATVTASASQQKLEPIALLRFSKHLFPSRSVHRLSARLAVNLMKTKEYKAANRVLADILRDEPRNPDVLNNLGFVLGEQDDFVKAEEYLRRAIEVSSKCAECENNLGSVLIKLNKLDEAKTRFERARQIDPRYIDAHLNYALLLEQMNDWNGAFEAYKKAEALVTDPELKKTLSMRIVWMAEIAQGGRRNVASRP
jgi:tetratricopeptide (TPR) repeat protein